MKLDDVTKTLLAALLVVPLVSCGKNEPPAPAVEAPAAMTPTAPEPAPASSPAASSPAQTSGPASAVEPAK